MHYLEFKKVTDPRLRQLTTVLNFAPLISLQPHKFENYFRRIHPIVI